MQYHFSLQISDTDIGFDVEHNRGQSMKQFRPGYFKTYQLFKKTCGDFGVLGITRLLDFLLGYLEMVTKFRVQFCCENFLLRHLLTLKHSNHFNVCLEFHDPFFLCSDGFTLINLKLSCCDHFIFSFSSYYYMKPYSSFFPFVAYLSVSYIYLSDSLPPCCLTL